MIDTRIRGKLRGLEDVSPDGYPLICHLIDTAVVAEVLWDSYLSRSQHRLISRALGLSEVEARATVALWAGLHDIGKAVPPWQGMIGGPGAKEGYATSSEGEDTARRHDTGSQLLIPPLLAELGYGTVRDLRGTPAAFAGIALGGHHGSFQAPTNPRLLPCPLTAYRALGDGLWSVQRTLIMQAIDAVTSPPRLAADIRIPGFVMPVITGLIMLADWLVSQEHHLIGLLRQAAPFDVTSPQAALAWAKKVRPLCEDLLDEAGLTAPTPAAPAPFDDMFPHIDTPNPLQTSIATHLPDLATGPGILLITAPPGDGKTETALYAAHHLAHTCGTHGLYVALPTQATANQMDGRVRTWAESHLPARSTLLHGAAWMHDDTPDARVITGHGPDLSATRWLRINNLRGLLAHLNVGTIDQALLSVLPLHRNPLRHLGLSGKTLVIDEAHAYDAFTQALLLRLLQWCGAWKTPVIVMSATLTGTTGAALVNAYRKGAGQQTATLDGAYPGWWWSPADTETIQTAPEPVRSSRERTLTVTRRAATTSTALLAIHRELAPLLNDQGCAAVICTTVTEAQTTYSQIAETLKAEQHTDTDLHLLHARLPQWQRADYTARAETAFGRVDKPTTRRPRRGIIVATQVIEQSLDLDFDLIISWLAPFELLMQRAGRAHRHGPDIWKKAGLTRPTWANTNPRITVLVPTHTNATPDYAPPRWGEVYQPSALQRTDELITRLTTPIGIPHTLQPLLEECYDPAFTSTSPETLAKTDAARLGDDAARRALANLALIPTPTRVSYSNLHRLTESTTDPDLITTRLGADALQLIPTFLDHAGNHYLDPERTTRLPQHGSATGGRFTKKQARDLMRYAVPVNATGWPERLPDENRPPAAWERDPRLARLAVLPHHPTAGGWSTLPIAGRRMHLDPTLGIVTQRA
ncbi:CRISPR-associated helicase/endonuclease Cas3 [Streptomyces natalensis]|uniref:CRISPR-associated helicase/endonuclease Cas3 n=1 Tax=Streptomyces natalensis TaxID=68242 RepID=UPI00068E8B06|nr:CRISPR-associated helicase/endonuclease Cas3 [Streptomyces natalensis]